MDPRGPSPSERLHPRIRGRLPVRYGIASTDRPATTENISEGGVFLATEEPLATGTPVTLRIEFPSGLVWHRGRVAWVRGKSRGDDDDSPPGLGIQFLETGPQWMSVFEEWRRHALGPVPGTDH